MIALITGGASGIGKLMATHYVESGYDVIIWDINTEMLNQVVSELKTKGNKVKGYSVDISDLDQINDTAQQVLTEDGVPDLLINNAGIVVGKYFNEYQPSDISKSMAVNAMAPMYITLAFINEMMKRNSGQICNITSSAGLISNPKMSVYAASKWAATGWSDSLRIEMNALKKNIKITTVTPYYINTGMFDGVKSRIFPILKPEKVVQKITKGIAKGKVYVSMPWPVWFVRLMQGLFPIWFFDWLVGGVFGIYKTMDDFKGKNK